MTSQIQYMVDQATLAEKALNLKLKVFWFSNYMGYTGFAVEIPKAQESEKLFDLNLDLVEAVSPIKKEDTNTYKLNTGISSPIQASNIKPLIDWLAVNGVYATGEEVNLPAAAVATWKLNLSRN